MYRNKNLEVNKIFKKHINRHEVDKNTAWLLYNRSCCLYDLWEYARTKTDSIITIGYGNVLSSIVIIFDSEKDSERLNFFTNVINALGKNLSDYYVTFHTKTNNDILDNIILKKELELLNPEKVISFKKINMTIPKVLLYFLDISDDIANSKEDKNYYNSEDVLSKYRKLLERE